MDTEPFSSLTHDQCRQARLSRDSRFDGQFFIGVKSTGIFCRPICPARLPKEENVEYFSNKAQAVMSGYRPCLRCRPDSAPNSWAWKGTETTFSRAVKLLDAGELQQQSLVQLSERLGISDRYLRQLFERHLGMSPKQYAQYQQLLFAKQLLHDSSMAVADIAFAAGFNSVRRFNDAFKKILKLTPSQVRGSRAGLQPENQLKLAYKGTLNWQKVLDFYQRRAVEGIETIQDNSYQRHVMIDGAPAWFQVITLKGNVVSITFELDKASQLQSLVSGVRRMLDLDADTDLIERHLEQIATGVVQQKGLRLLGTWNLWEAGVRAIIGQQVSVNAAIKQLNTLAKALASNPDKQLFFPTPEQIVADDLACLRMPNSRKETLKRFALFMIDNPEAQPEEWLALKGIGPWTVSYACLRGQSRPNCLLEHDLVVKNHRAHFPTLTAENVSPWGSYATYHLWNYQQ